MKTNRMSYFNVLVYAFIYAWFLIQEYSTPMASAAFAKEIIHKHQLLQRDHTSGVHQTRHHLHRDHKHRKNILENSTKLPQHYQKQQQQHQPHYNNSQHQHQHQHQENSENHVAQSQSQWQKMKKIQHKLQKGSRHTTAKSSSRLFLGISKSQQNNDNPLYLEAVTANTHNNRRQVVKPLHFTDTSFLLNPKTIMSTYEHTQGTHKQKNNKNKKSSANIENESDYSYYDEYNNGDVGNDSYDSMNDDANIDDEVDEDGDVYVDGDNDDGEDGVRFDAYDDDYKLNDHANDNRLSQHENTRVPREYHHHNFQYNSQDSMESSDNNAPEKNRNSNHTLTEEKFNNYGTKEAVQRSHQRYIQNQYELDLAKRHRERMESEARCSRPMKRVIYISNETSRNYIPRCTILYRCGDDTGCCRSITEVCTNKTAELINVYVFVSEVNSRYFPQKIAMYNHTECHCVKRANLYEIYMPRDKRASHDNSVANCQCPTHFESLTHQYVSPERMHLSHTTTTTTTTTATENCRCDCYADNVTCQRLKNGTEGFALNDRRCINNHQCKAPTCTFGRYNMLTGRCPRQAQFEGIS